MGVTETSPVKACAGAFAVGRVVWSSTGSPSRGGSWGSRPGSGAQQRLDRATLVHRLVALGGLLQRQGEVEDLARIDLAVADQLDQLGQEPAHRGRAVVQVHLGEEQLL